jgi:hypothetical protein
MPNPTAWPATALPPTGLPPAPPFLEAETEAERQRRALAAVEADLEQHRAALSKLQRELMASRLEVSDARGETVQFQVMLRRAQEEAAKLDTAHRGLASRDAEIMRLHSVIASLQGETLALKTGMDILRSSFSWRISAPVRVVGRLIRAIVARRSSLRQVLRRPPAPLDGARSAADAPATLPGPVDPNARAMFQATALAELRPGEAEGVVTLDALFHLSRSL